jgi:beta-glucosidase
MVYKLGQDIHVSVTIRNSGKRDATEVVQVYICDRVASVTWVTHQLKGFKRQLIKAGERITVDIVIPVDSCWIINKKAQRVVEPGLFEARVAKASNDIKFKLEFAVT